MAEPVGMRRHESLAREGEPDIIPAPYEYKKTTVETLTIGLDLGDRRHQACVLDEAGEILAEEEMVNTREVLTAFNAR